MITIRMCHRPFYLVRAEYDDSSSYDFVYQNALMVEETDTLNNVFTKSFDSSGRIIDSEDPEGGKWSFYSAKDELTKILTYGYSTVENNTYESQLSYLLNGDRKIITTFADNSTYEKITQADGFKETYKLSGIQSVIDNVVDEKTKRKIPQTITVALPSGKQGSVQINKTYAEGGTDTSKSTVTLTNNGRSSTVSVDIKTGQQVITSPESRTATSQWDPLTGLQTGQQIAGLEPISYQYDSRGRLTSATSGDRITSYNYNDQVSKGALTSITDAEQQVTGFEYDVMGRVSKITYHDGRILEQSYDNNGNLVSLTPPGQPTHYFNYNGVGHETSYTPPDVADVTNPATTYDYDRDRKLTTITRPDGQQLLFNYTAGTNQLASMSIPRGIYSYVYDSHGNVTDITAPD
ncbi:hypothetical protein, partial [Thalassotalea fusca]